LVATLGILATALGPVMLGWLLDRGKDFGVVTTAACAACFVAVALSCLARYRIGKPPHQPGP
jgi:cyanate permease